jgi:hypothetical protein
MIAVWKEFVQRSFLRTKFRTTFNGATRTVYQDGFRLYVLDEYHGDLEVLARQTSPGEAKHLGSEAIVTEYQSPAGGGKCVVTAVRRGVFKPGAKHRFVLTGSL